MATEKQSTFHLPGFQCNKHITDFPSSFDADWVHEKHIEDHEVHENGFRGKNAWRRDPFTEWSTFCGN